MSTVSTGDAPRPAGHYSQAVRAGDFVFVSGQVPIDPGSGRYRPGSIAEETTLTLRNLEAIAAAAGGSLRDAVKISAYLADIADFAEYDRAYGAFFADEPPARTTVAAGLHGFRVEIAAVLHLPRRG
jgi:2-iminobutanoate/2-iminopropanoate deaminase